MSSIIIKSSRITNPRFLSRKKGRIQNLNNEEGSGNLLINLAKDAASKAIRESKALGLSITYAEDNIIYREEPNGNRIEIGRIPAHY